MDWADEPWEPEAAPFRILFQLPSSLSEDQRNEFLRQLVSEPFHLDEAEVGRDGAGWVLYSRTIVKVTERSDVEGWLRAHPLVRNVRLAPAEDP